MATQQMQFVLQAYKRYSLVEGDYTYVGEDYSPRDSVMVSHKPHEDFME